MQVSVESLEGLARRVTVDIPAERVDVEVDRRLKSLSHEVKISGFRPGKVPFHVVKRNYGGKVRHEVVGDVMQSSFYEAVTQEKLRPAGAPQIEPTKDSAGENLQFTATFEIYPEVELVSLDGIEYEQLNGEITAQDVDNTIDTIRKQAAEWVEVQRAANTSDRVIIDFVGTIDDVPFEGNEAKEMPLELGAGKFIPGFEAGLEGAKAGEEKILDLQFPDDYHSKEVAGKPVKFVVTVHKVEEQKLPEINDELAKKFGIAEGGVEKLREEIQRSMQRELEQAAKRHTKQLVTEKMIELHKFDLPQAVVDNEIQHLQEQAKSQYGGAELPKELFDDQARRRVSLGLLFAEVIQANNLVADDEKVRAAVDGIAAGYEQPDSVVQWYYGDKSRLAEVESMVLEEQVVEWILAQGKTKEVTKSFDEITKPKAA